MVCFSANCMHRLQHAIIALFTAGSTSEATAVETLTPATCSILLSPIRSSYVYVHFGIDRRMCDCGRHCTSCRGVGQLSEMVSIYSRVYQVIIQFQRSAQVESAQSRTSMFAQVAFSWRTLCASFSSQPRILPVTA